MKNKLNYFLIFAYFVSVFVSSCNLRSPSTTESSPDSAICHELTWNQVISSLQNNLKSSSEYNNPIYSYISSCQLKSNEIDDLINLYNSLNSSEKLSFLGVINQNSSNSKKFINFYKNLASSENPYLAFFAIQKFVNIEEIDYLLNIYKSSNDDIRKILLILMSNFLNFPDQENDVKNDPKVLALYLSVAASDHKTLAPIALGGLTGGAGDKRWTTWNWQPEIIQILQQAVEKDIYKLSLLSDEEMVVLTQKYPNSRYTKSCIEYRNFTEGEYFGASVGVWGSDNQAVFRQPFNPDRELQFWPQFLRKYPNHPGSDDALYRIARSYEIQGDYEQALIWYYQSSISPDDSMHDVALERILFLIDLLMSSNTLEQFLKNHPKHFLSLHIEYSKAIHLIRENRLQDAILALENVLKKYRGINRENSPYFSEPISYKYTYSQYKFQSESDKNDFVNKLEIQLKRIKKITEIRQQGKSDQTLYEEAAFWFNYDYLAYNHLWRLGGLSWAFRFLPEQWEGVKTSTRMTITFDFVKTANKNYKSQNRHLKSIELLEKLLKEYPNSELAAKAKYSIGLNYYYLGGGRYPEFTDQVISWNDLALKSFTEFAVEFPDSSMADDALLTMAELVYDHQNPNHEIEILEKIVRDYPNGDRYEQAKQRLDNLKSNNQHSNIQTSPKPAFPIVGIKMKNLETDNGVVIVEILPNLPASKAGLQPEDIILRVDNEPITKSEDVARIIRQHQIGETVDFEIKRRNKKIVVEVGTTSSN